MADFTVLPKEVISHHIFPHLQLNDLLRLRRVNKVIKSLAEDYIRVHHVQSNQFIDICVEGERENLAAFLALDFVAPVSRFDFSDLEPEKMDEDRMHEFVKIYGNRVTHLNIRLMQIPVSRKTVQFFESLPNLEYLKIWEVEERGYQCRNKKEIALRVSNVKELPQSIPRTFRRLRTLIIDFYGCAPRLMSVGLFWKFIEECSAQLEFLQHPMYDVQNKGKLLRGLPGGHFGFIREMIMKGPNPSTLKFYDIEECIGSDFAGLSVARNFYELVRTCAEYNVKLLNVTAFLIEYYMELEIGDEEEKRRMISSVVASLDSLHRSSFLLELPHLEKIRIGDGMLSFLTGGGTSAHCSMPDDDFHRQSWPSLRELDIVIDSKWLFDNIWMGPSDTRTCRDLLDYFFVGIQREKMEKLSIWFDIDPEAWGDDLPYPRIIDVCTSCPNLKELSLEDWPGRDDDMSLLWGNLPLLEKLTLKGDTSLGNAAFVGEDEENPAFRKAIKLHNFFLDLTHMPGITDTFFSQVLRHMPLKELYLISNTTLLENRQITLAGISSLLDGVLSETIEKFELSISLDGVTKEELVALERKFRSSRMI